MGGILHPQSIPHPEPSLGPRTGVDHTGEPGLAIAQPRQRPRQADPEQGEEDVLLGAAEVIKGQNAYHRAWDTVSAR